MVNSLTNFFYFKDNVGYFKHCIKKLKTMELFPLQRYLIL